MAQTIQFRRGTSAEWTAANPVLSPGEPGFETDTGKIKLGDGASDWAALTYVGTGGGVAIGGAVAGGAAHSTLSLAAGSLLDQVSNAPLQAARAKSGELSIASVTAYDVCALALPAGTFDLSAMIGYDCGGLTGGLFDFGIDTSSVSLPSAAAFMAVPSNGRVRYDTIPPDPATGQFVYTIPSMRVILASPTTYYLVTFQVFTGGTLAVYGSLNATQVTN